MATSVFEVSIGGSIVFTAINNATLNEVLLSRLDGWDESPQANLKLEPKLSTNGSYVIDNHVEKRELQLEAHFMSGGFAVSKTLQTAVLNGTVVTMTMNRIDGSETSSVVRTGFITSTGYKEVNGKSLITAFITCPNPA